MKYSISANNDTMMWVDNMDWPFDNIHIMVVCELHRNGIV